MSLSLCLSLLVTGSFLLPDCTRRTKQQHQEHSNIHPLSIQLNQHQSLCASSGVKIGHILTNFRHNLDAIDTIV
uniref:Putative secreted protein n=1 Tax=Anopheles darlingi TaxID=43151 RepID=A0A2M4DLQ1_ANODA